MLISCQVLQSNSISSQSQGFLTISFALKFPLLFLTMNMYSLKTFYHHFKSLIRGENSLVFSQLHFEITIISKTILRVYGDR